MRRQCQNNNNNNNRSTLKILIRHNNNNSFDKFYFFLLVTPRWIYSAWIICLNILCNLLLEKLNFYRKIKKNRNIKPWKIALSPPTHISFHLFLHHCCFARFDSCHCYHKIKCVTMIIIIENYKNSTAGFNKRHHK